MLRHSRCFENGNDGFGVEAFWAIHCAHWSSGFNFTGSWSALYLIGDAARVWYFVPLNGPLNGHPPSIYIYIIQILSVCVSVCQV